MEEKKKKERKESLCEGAPTQCGDMSRIGGTIAALKDVDYIQLAMPLLSLSHRARDAPITVSYGGHPVNEETKKWFGSRHQPALRHCASE